MTKPNNHSYFINIAKQVSERGSCLRKKTGCVITYFNNSKEKIISTGYNGTDPGDEECLTHGCLINNLGRCSRTTHAEINAIKSAIEDGNEQKLIGATAYVTISPCIPCLENLKKAGISKIVIGECYRPEESRVFTKENNIELIELNGQYNFDSIVYQPLLKNVFENGVDQFNERLNKNIKVIPGVHFEWDMAKGYPLSGLRKLPRRLAIAEQLFFLTGSKDVTWFKQYSKAWDAFVKDDGTLTASYGFRYRQALGIDQFKKNIEMLQKDSSSRQACFSIWIPNTDGVVKRPNIPCLPFWTVNIVNGKLNIAMHQRSCDLVLGLPHDVAGIVFMAHILAKKLNVAVGKLSYQLAHAHIYEDHYETVKELITTKADWPSIQLPTLKCDIYDIIMSDNIKQKDKNNLMSELVDEIGANLDSQYKHGKEFKELIIAS